jgi:hypothetical protein
MESHDFSEIYEIGGPLMKEAIMARIIEEGVDKNVDEKVTECIQHLLSLNDDEFEQTYLDICKYNGRLSGLGVLEYTYACVSNITLVQKCLSISIVPLMCLFNWLPNYATLYIKFDYESCRILHINNFDIYKLYFLASSANNYNALNYLLDHMILKDFAQILFVYDHIDFNLSNILLIDKIYGIDNKFIHTLLKAKMLSLKTVLPPKTITFLTRCYYIIKFNIIPTDYSHVISPDKDNARYTPLLEFYLRPRGKHTKNAISSHS